MVRRDKKEFEDRETDRKYIKFKMKEVKRAENRGNHAAARRHATELVQYLNLAEDTETPVEDALEPLE